MSEFVASTSLLLALLNPFLLVVYLLDIIKNLNPADFRNVLLRAGLIATVVFCTFALIGDALFSRIIQVQFASFQIFGGIVFLLIGLQFVFRGPESIEILRGESAHVAGAVAMPVLIGPGTISASVIIGERNSPMAACLAIVVAVVASLFIVVALKAVHDYVKPRKEQLIDRYIEIAGRITALYVGTVAIEMIMIGLKSWVVPLLK